MSKFRKLNNGNTIPTIGLGTYKSKPGEVEEAVKYAIDIGYRHFDCAWFYANEKEVGDALQAKLHEGVVKREELFVVTKLWNNFHEKKNVVPMLRESLKSLQLEYVDLFLIHWPFGFKETADGLPTDGTASYSDVDYLETWEGMEECVKSGLTKSIGISNFNKEQVARLVNNCRIKPVVNQVEVNPNINQKELIQFCKERDIVVVGFCPLGRSTQSTTISTYPRSTILDPKVIEVAKKYNKTPAQVILRYLVSLGICVIPKSVTKSRILENFDIFDFELEQKDVAYLDSCNTNQRVSPMSVYKDHKYYPF
uniref:1,5-anhydro-D-fructose reductase n=1 Tax=Anoplophora glabripennis TaxID=217634 RepID=V5GT06_ANOGL